jgi:hypothetical protein
LENIGHGDGVGDADAVGPLLGVGVGADAGPTVIVDPAAL